MEKVKKDINVTQNHIEISEEQKQQRALEVGLLFEQKEWLIKSQAEREKKKSEELVVLRGNTITTGEYLNIISIEPYPYIPKFPYSIPYFKELYRLYYPDRNFKEYPKPRFIGTLFRELIYGRFNSLILPALKALNPIVGINGRRRKLFQHLNTEGQSDLEKFRDETIEIMQKCSDGNHYEFRKKLYELYKVPYQIEMFEKK